MISFILYTLDVKNMKPTTEIIKQIRRKRKKKKKKISVEKRIIKHAASLKLLKNNGASIRDLLAWLRREKRIKTSVSYLFYLINDKKILVQPEPITIHKQQKTLSELHKIQAHRKRNRTKKFNQSKLDKYANEIIPLAENSIFLSEVRDWLRQTKRLSVSKSQLQKRLIYWEKEKETFLVQPEPK